MRPKDLIIESSLTDLYKSTVNAFPNTTKRQHATDPIKIVELKWTPFLGMKTLFVRGVAHNENRTYNPMILFKKVSYHKQNTKGVVELHTNEGEQVFLERLSFDNNGVLVRCNCKDFHWRFTHWDSLDKSLYGRDRKKYEAKYNPGSANPTESPGMCKHIMKLTKVLQESGLIF